MEGDSRLEKLGTPWVVKLHGSCSVAEVWASCWRVAQSEERFQHIKMQNEDICCRCCGCDALRDELLLMCKAFKLLCITQHGSPFAGYHFQKFCGIGIAIKVLLQELQFTKSRMGSRLLLLFQSLQQHLIQSPAPSGIATSLRGREGVFSDGLEKESKNPGTTPALDEIKCIQMRETKREETSRYFELWAV